MERKNKSADLRIIENTYKYLFSYISKVFGVFKWDKTLGSWREHFACERNGSEIREIVEKCSVALTLRVSALVKSPHSEPRIGLVTCSCHRTFANVMQAED